MKIEYKITNKQQLVSSVIFLFIILLPAQSGAAETVQYQIKDYDGDGLSDQDEMSLYFTNPFNKDTDDDGYLDKEELENHYSPWDGKNKKLKNLDSDEDGLNDNFELRLGSGLRNSDSDGDGISDGEELKNSTSPVSKDNVKISKLIETNIAEFQLNYYFGETLMDSFKVSTGRKYMETPKGEFTILAKVPSKDYGGTGYNFYYPRTKWNLHFTTGKNKLRYFIHGAYWHDLFGKKNVSSGCVNVRYEDMEELYEFADVGTKLVIR